MRAGTNGVLQEQTLKVGQWVTPGTTLAKVVQPERLKGAVLELGGKDAQIVCADANLEHAVAGCLWGSFANAGQTCAGIERVYVVSAFECVAVLLSSSSPARLARECVRPRLRRKGSGRTSG